jgi:hypothetical protein
MRSLRPVWDTHRNSVSKNRKQTNKNILKSYGLCCGSSVDMCRICVLGKSNLNSIVVEWIVGGDAFLLPLASRVTSSCCNQRGLSAGMKINWIKVSSCPEEPFR